MLESAFGFGGFANKGPWTIRFGYSTLTLEDDDSNYDVEWDKAEGGLTLEYAFYKGGKHTFGILGGLAYTDHD